MRDLLLFVVCCALAVGFWLSSRRHSEERAAAIQTELYQLGAPQTMEDSPERSLLLGDFAKGLRADPSPETYEKLAPLFLATHELKDRKLVASAFHVDGMGRVIGKALEFFDPKGKPLSPRLWALADKVTPTDKPVLEVATSPTLVADGSWLLYKDKKHSAVFRSFGDELRGYVSSKEIGVDGDTLLIAGKKTWEWSQGQLITVPKS